MLFQEASKMSLKVVVLDLLENYPASVIAYKHVVGSFRDTNDLQEFTKGYGNILERRKKQETARRKKEETARKSFPIERRKKQQENLSFLLMVLISDQTNH